MAEHSEQPPVATGVAALFGEFAPGGHFGVLARFHHSGAEFYADLVEPVAILLNHHEQAFAGNGNHVHPRWIFEYVEFIVYLPVWELYDVAARGEPRPSYQILAA